MKLASFAADLGFRVIVVLDGDRAGDDAEANAAAVCHAVVRLPRNHAIERALVEGLDDAHVRKALESLGNGFGATIPIDLATASEDALRRIAYEVIKSSGGLHAQFVELLPRNALPPVAVAVLDAIRNSARGQTSGVIAL